MAGEVENLNLIGTWLAFLADGLFVLVATTEARAEETQDEECKKAAAYLVSTFNIIGAWAQLIGDYLLLKAVQMEFDENLKSNKPFDEQAGRLDILVSGSQVVIDVLEVQLAERGAEIVQ